MDKLQPVLKYHFWILLFVALIMAFVGWWMTTGEMKGSITARRQKIEDAKKKIPDSKDHPNKSWDDALAKINSEQEQLIRYSKAWLYTRQKEAMVWPNWMPEQARKMKDANDTIDNAFRVIYRNNYIKEVLRVYEIPKPTQDARDPKGVVIFPFGLMPHREWGDATPTSKQVYESMEDLWLLEPVLRAIDDTNGGKTANRQEASVVQIDYVRLHGGDRSTVGQTASAGSEGFGGGAGMLGPQDDEGPAARGMPTMAMSGPQISLDINPLDEFGNPGSGDAGMNVDSEPIGGGAGMPGMAQMAGGGGGGMRASVNEELGRRYIDDDEKQPFKTRGFKLTVIMDHRRVPDLYANLTSREHSPWPIKIVRMNIADFKEGGSSTGGFGGGFGGYGAGADDDDDRASILSPRGGGGNNPFGGGNNPFGGPGGAKGGLPGILKPGMKIKSRDPEEDEAMSNAAMENPLERPYLARVTLLGLITMYREPAQAETPASTGSQPSEAVAADPSAESGEVGADPGEGTVDTTAPSSLDGAEEALSGEVSAEDEPTAGNADAESASEEAEMKEADPEMSTEDEASPTEDAPTETAPEDAAAEEGAPPDEKPDQTEQ